MPTYQYACKKCGKAFERTESIREHGSKKVRCPHCKSTAVTQTFGAFAAITSKKS